MIEQDWYMRQIQMLIQFISRTLFHKDYIEYQPVGYQPLSGDPDQTDLLHAKLLDLIAAKQYGRAEDYLFDHYQPDNLLHIRLAIDFYQRLNALSDQELEQHQFSREEIDEGLRELMRRSHFDLHI